MELKNFTDRSLDLIRRCHEGAYSDGNPDVATAGTQDAVRDRMRRIPVRVSEICGPVNLYRFEYGRWWLQERCGKEDFLNQIRLAGRGPYLAFEALNFADGVRSIKEITELLSAEFSQVPEDEVADFFDFLKDCGIVSFNADLSMDYLTELSKQCFIRTNGI